VLMLIYLLWLFVVGITGPGLKIRARLVLSSSLLSTYNSSWVLSSTIRLFAIVGFE